MPTPSAQLPPPAIDVSASGAPGPIPFRQATIERVSQLQSESSLALTAATQLFDRNIDGSGFLYGIVLRVFATASGNSALVNFAEDAPYNVLDTVRFHDANGDSVNTTGWGLHLANRLMKDYGWRDMDSHPLTSVYNIIAGSGANAGTFAVTMRVPVAINRRDLIGLLGNQDRASIYQILTNVAASGTIYGTAPTSVPAITIEKHMETYSFPLPNAPVPGSPPQGQLPQMYGTMHVVSRALSEAVPTGGSQVPHFLRRFQNTIRAVAFQWRSNGSRVTAQANMPTSLTFKAGDDGVYNEGLVYRQMQNFEKYGDRNPDGSLFYDFIHDFGPGAGAELGADWVFGQQLQNIQLLATYPSGMGSTNNSLEIITLDMLMGSPR